MAQHDYTIANQGFPAFRSDLNDALAAIVSNNSGATEPTTMFAHQMWVDTAANPSVLKIRNADNDAWITVGTINQTGDTFTLTSAVSATTLNTSGAVVFNDAGADVDFRVEGDTDANLLFVDAGNDRVGIGTSSPGVKFAVNQTGATGYFLSGQVSGTEIAYWYYDANQIQFSSKSAGRSLTFLTADTARMTLDSSGTLLVGKTSDNEAVLGFRVDGNGTSEFTNTDSGTQYPIAFYRAGSAAAVGSISTTSSATAYNTSSDYRLKENVAPMTGALAKVLELNPVTYTWKIDGSAGEGFIAHELQAICPEAVTGEKDATEIKQVEVSPAVPATYDDEGNELTPAVEAVYEEREAPVYQGVDTSFLVATLTAAIQELSAKNDALEARIAALENA